MSLTSFCQIFADLTQCTAIFYLPPVNQQKTAQSVIDGLRGSSSASEPPQLGG